MRKRLLIEEDIDELSDFQKILLLNKKKLSPYDVDFINSKDDDFDEIVQVTESGLRFNFHGLEDFLKFFFPEFFEEGSDSEWEANNYNSMYYGNWDWYGEIYDSATEDWKEGYIIDSIPKELVPKLIELLNTINPKLSKKIKENGISDEDKHELTDFLGGLGFEDDLTDIYITANVRATEDNIKEYFENRYCNAPEIVGITTLSCFYRYELRWGNAIMLIADGGNEDQKILDSIINEIEKKFNNHASEYYDIRHEAWNRETYDYVLNAGWSKFFDNLEEKIIDGDYFSEEYLETLRRLLTIYEFDKYYKLPGSNKKISIDGINTENNKIKYKIVSGNSWAAERSEIDLERLINMTNNYSLFND
jgi:hypothetical protein